MIDFLSLNYPVKTNPSWNVIDTSKLKKFWGECRRAYFYEYVLGWRLEIPSIHTHFGQALHDALEFLLLNGYTVEAVNHAHEELFLPKYREMFSPEQDKVFSPKNPARAKRALIDYSGLYRDDLKNYRVLHTEVGGSVSINDKFKLTFRMDAVLQRLADDLIVIMDHKTGTSFNSQWEQKYLLDKQIGTYLHAAFCFFGKDKVREMIINGLFFHKVKDDTASSEKHSFKRISCTRTKDQMRIWLATVNRICEQLEAEMFLLSSESASSPTMKSFPCNENACFSYGRKCAYHDFCCYWPNPLQQADNGPPLGFKLEFWNPLAHIKKDISESKA